MSDSLNQENKKEENKENWMLWEILSIKDEEKENNKEEKLNNSNIIFNININSLEDLIKILNDFSYDFLTVEPEEQFVKVIFRKDQVVKKVDYIKNHIYSKIILSAKLKTKLDLKIMDKSQEWSWDIEFRDNIYSVVTKIAPWDFWEKLFLKIKSSQGKKEIRKAVKKTPIGKIIGFLWALALVWLIMWWTFITFVVLNAQTVEDVKFFYSLWISLNDINTFISKTIQIIFSIVVFIETLLVAIFLFKFFLTKKEFKKRRIWFWILWITLLIITFITWSFWLVLTKKVNALPNWQEEALWDIQIYDNLKLISNEFDKINSFIENPTRLIWPVTLKFDLESFVRKEERKWFTIEKYIWDFWWKDVIETLVPSIIRDFEKEWTYEMSIYIVEKDLNGKIIEKEVEWAPSISITKEVKITQENSNSWWKIVKFDASDLSDLWKIEWYMWDDYSKPIWKWEIFTPWKAIFEETIVSMNIIDNNWEQDTIDKVFIISWTDKTSIEWNIKAISDPVDELNYEFSVENIDWDFWEWYIEEFTWIIWGKEIKKKWDINEQELSSKITYDFKSYWEHDIKVIMKNSLWNTKELTTKINITKKIRLKDYLRIFSNGTEINKYKYDSKTNEYFISDLIIPTEIELDSRRIKSDDPLYTLDSVEWDIKNDWTKDSSSDVLKYNIETLWNHTIWVKYIFRHRKIDDLTLELKEYVYIEWIKKDNVVDIQIEKDSDYVPVIVRFDWSKSRVKNSDIVKFIWDYWDGVKEERDAIVEWHKYAKAWEYEIKLKVVTDSWEEFEAEKTLVLKPRPQNVEISSSLKKAPTYQWIDFSSEKSEWQIVAYFWDFWDWNTSSDANPTHSYKRAWTYLVNLRIDFANNNVEEDQVEIEIY